jgi:predicted nucleic acid-binding Zn ribbon protein
MKTLNGEEPSIRSKTTTGASVVSRFYRPIEAIGIIFKDSYFYAALP